jgi:hypothetical protein
MLQRRGTFVMRLDLPRRTTFQASAKAAFLEGFSPTIAQRRWLRRGLDQPGGKLPLFTRDGQRVSASLVRACLVSGWAEPWFANPLKPDWLVCKLTPSGRRAIQ